MPQLNPAPWFNMLIISWLIFFWLINSMTSLYLPKPLMPIKQTLASQAKHWTWAWQ